MHSVADITTMLLYSNGAEQQRYQRLRCTASRSPAIMAIAEAVGHYRSYRLQSSDDPRRCVSSLKAPHRLRRHGPRLEDLPKLLKKSSEKKSSEWGIQQARSQSDSKSKPRSKSESRSKQEHSLICELFRRRWMQRMMQTLARRRRRRKRRIEN